MLNGQNLFVMRDCNVFWPEQSMDNWVGTVYLMP